MRGGFTLVEIVVALVVLQVGLLGVVGSLLLGATTLAEAHELERVVSRMEWVYDSLVAAPAPVDGEESLEKGALHWRVGGGGTLTLEYARADGDVVARVHGLHTTVLPFGGEKP